MDIHEISKELGFRKYESSGLKDGYGYKGVFGSGDFTCLGDYNTGLLAVDVKNGEQYPVVTITTIDNGVWQGTGNRVIDVDEFVIDFDKNFGLKLPTENILNEFLMKYNIFGFYNG